MEAQEKWQVRCVDEEIGEVLGAVAAQSDAMLLGRRRYEEFAAFWPSQGSEVSMADYMNSTPKHVVSTTLDSVAWARSSLVTGDVAEEVATLKRGPGRNINIPAPPRLVRSLFRDGLLDELDLLVHPIVVGGGKRLFENGNYGTDLRLVDSRRFGTGVVLLTYVPVRTRVVARA